MKEASLKATYFLIPNTRYCRKYKTTEVVRKKNVSGFPEPRKREGTLSREFLKEVKLFYMGMWLWITDTVHMWDPLEYYNVSRKCHMCKSKESCRRLRESSYDRRERVTTSSNDIKMQEATLLKGMWGRVGKVKEVGISNTLIDAAAFPCFS